MNSFIDFWNAYQKKVGKDKVESKWYRLSAQDHILIMNHVHGFVAKQRNKQYRPNPLSYLNGKMWLNEDITQEEKLVYKQPSQPKLSDYKPKEFERSEGIAHMRAKLKANYELCIPIFDYGNVYTTLLTEKCKMRVPDRKQRAIRVSEEYQAERYRNRSEEQYKGNVDSNVRDRILNWWLDFMRDEKREIWKEI